MNDKRIKVLLIEDDPEYVRLVRNALAVIRTASFDLECADRLSTGLERLAAGGIDVVLLDLLLLDGHGFDIFTRAYGRAVRVPIIVLVGLDDEALAIKMVQEGVQDYLVDQVDGNLLARSIRCAIERNRAEEELDRVFDLSLDMLCIADLDGYFKRLNPAFEITLGYAKEELLARPLVDFIHPQDQALFVAEMQRLATGAPGVYFENRCRCKDGSCRWLEWRVVPVLAKGLIYAVARDVTERKEAEEVLRRRNEELMALNAIATTMSRPLDLDRILNVTLDEVLEVVEMDAGWIQLLDEDEDGGSLSLVVHRGFSQEMAREIRTVRLGEGLTGKVAQLGRPIVVDKVSEDPRLSMETGRREALHAFGAVPIKSRDKVLGVLGVFSRRPRQLSSQEVQLLTAIGHHIGMAIENVRLAEEASEMEILQELNRLRSELIANVSHELRTPLGLIKVFCTTLLSEDVEFGRETQLECLRTIDEEADKLEEIVDNLLDLSRMESDRLRLDKRFTDVGQLVREVIEAVKLEIDVTNLNSPFSIVHDFPPDSLMLHVDARRIEQVLRNLLGNAIKYSPEGGAITVRGRRDKWQILIGISDQGIGIPPGDLERIFERFYRAENEITQSVSGVGLGLAVCRGIVEAHDGRIWAESMPGVGSTFYFSLPVGGSDIQTSEVSEAS
jgi:PAS domain S-box-containing protein